MLDAASIAPRRGREAQDLARTAFTSLDGARAAFEEVDAIADLWAYGGHKLGAEESAVFIGRWTQAIGQLDQALALARGAFDRAFVMSCLSPRRQPQGFQIADSLANEDLAERKIAVKTATAACIQRFGPAFSEKLNTISHGA